MQIIDGILNLWPVGVLLVGIGVRLEVGQALNRQRMKAVEQGAEDMKARHKEAISGVHARLARHENETSEFLREIRSDIKTLLQRGG